MTKIVAIADTHGLHDKVKIEPCDILIHAGDWTSEGNIDQVKDFAKWLLEQPTNQILLVPGNHERYYEKVLPDSISWIKDLDIDNKICLEHHGKVEIAGIKFFLSAYSPLFGHDWAFNAGRDPIEAAHSFKPFIGDLWKDIPEETEILVTHGMPYGILDEAFDYSRGKISNVGDKELLNRIKDLKQLKYYIGGHLHKDGGKSFISGNVTYYNVAQCDDSYRITRVPTIINY